MSGQPTRKLSPGRIVVGLCLSLLAIFVVAFLEVYVFVDPPGGGEKANRGYRAANAMMRAVYSYRAANGRFPASVDALRQAGSRPPTFTEDGSPLRYDSDGANFELGFKYSGPGMNECVYSSVTREWSCHGWY